MISLLVVPLFFCLLLLKSVPIRRLQTLPPGPSLVSLVASLVSLWRLPLHCYFEKLASAYGPIVYVKFGLQRYVVVSNLEMAEQVLRVHDTEFADRPRTTFGECFSYGCKDIGLSPYGDSWRRLKRFASSHLLNPDALNFCGRFCESEMESAIRDILGRCESGPVDIKAVIGRFVSNSFCLTLFGKKDVPRILELVHMTEKQARSFNIGNLFPALDSLDLHGVNNEMRNKLMPQLRSLLSEIIHEHRQEASACNRGKDFTHVLLSCRDDAGDFLSDISIMAMLTDFLAAGIENLCGAIEWALAELLNNPRVMQKAQEELEQEVGRGRLVRSGDVKNLRYIQAVYKEVLRLHPTGPLGVPHMNREEVTLAGYTIPKGTSVLVNLWAIGRDAQQWDEPLTFEPERFMSANGNSYMNIMKMKMIPFSAGCRACPGYPIAAIWIPFAIASLLHAFHFQSVTPIDLGEKGDTISSKLASELLLQAIPLDLSLVI